jgi:hypothetical protein
MRPDLIVAYTRISAETMKYSKEGTDIMIKNGWLEEPPKIVDHTALNIK